MRSVPIAMTLPESARGGLGCDPLPPPAAVLLGRPLSFSGSFSPSGDNGSRSEGCRGFEGQTVNPQRGLVRSKCPAGVSHRRRPHDRCRPLLTREEGEAEGTRRRGSVSPTLVPVSVTPRAHVGQEPRPRGRFRSRSSVLAGGRVRVHLVAVGRSPWGSVGYVSRITGLVLCLTVERWAAVTPPPTAAGA